MQFFVKTEMTLAGEMVVSESVAQLVDILVVEKADRMENMTGLWEILMENRLVCRRVE